MRFDTNRFNFVVVFLNSSLRLCCVLNVLWSITTHWLWACLQHLDTKCAVSENYCNQVFSGVADVALAHKAPVIHPVIHFEAIPDGVNRVSEQTSNFSSQSRLHGLEGEKNGEDL